MPSEDVKKEAAELDDDKSLGSLIQPQKKNLTNAATSTTKSRPKVKKEDPLDDDLPIKPKVKASSSFSGSQSKAAKVKKQESKDEDDDDNKPIVGRVKKEVNEGSNRKPLSTKNSSSSANADKLKELNNKRKKKGEENNAPAATQKNGRKRAKKVYDLPGQKRDSPEERDPLRIFYETLYKQIPKSEMAQIWMMESGLLSKEEAKKVFEKKQRKNQQTLTSPKKAVSTAKKSQSATVKKKTPISRNSSTEKATADSNSKQSKKRKIEDGSSGNDSDDDFVIKSCAKKQRAS